MKKYILLFLVLFACSAYAQKISIPADTIVESFHETTINNKVIHYKAEVGTQPVWNKSGEPIATLFYTYYKRIAKEKENAYKEKETIIKEMEMVKVLSNPKEEINILKKFSSKWESIGHVPRNKMDINARFFNLLNSKFSEPMSP